MPVAPFLSKTPLRFRAVPDSLAQLHVECSECCLIHADNPLSPTKGIYLNPRVRVGYNDLAYAAVHPHTAWISLHNIALALWENRIRRWTTSVFFKKRIIRRRITSWERYPGTRSEPAAFCLINEMQVLVGNGWAHV